MSLHFEGSGLQQHLLCTGEPGTVAGRKSKRHPRACAAEGLITLDLSLGRQLFADGDVCRDSPGQGQENKRTQRRK